MDQLEYRQTPMDREKFSRFLTRLQGSNSYPVLSRIIVYCNGKYPVEEIAFRETLLYDEIMQCVYGYEFLRSVIHK
jgi:hypothetical protein